MKPQKFFITGHKSGLGRYLYEQFGGFGFDVGTPIKNFEKIEKSGVDVIIHCAFNNGRDITSDKLYNYISTNIFLIQRLSKIPHKKFIFISSIDVYPKNSTVHTEKENIPLDSVSNLYAITKLMAESIVTNSLILRCGALLGVYARQNSLIKIIDEKKPITTLSAKSEFNYVLHSQLGEFIKVAIEKDLKGVYNFASSSNMTLKKVAKLFNKEVKFGTFEYKAGKISNKKIRSVFPALEKTSSEIIGEFIKQR